MPRPYDEFGKPCSERSLLQQKNHVKIEVSSSRVTIKWYMAVANWASLYFVKDWISAYHGPFDLMFFNSGWFEETYETSVSAKRRIAILIQKSDIRLTAKAYTRDFYGSTATITDELVELLKHGAPNVEKAVICNVDQQNNNIDILSIGKSSLLANIWGGAHTSFPCQKGHSYDKTVSRAYFRAINENRPIYDQVLASMVKPNGNVQWVGYQRVIFPMNGKSSDPKSVSINCVQAPIDIPLF